MKLAEGFQVIAQARIKMHGNARPRVVLTRRAWPVGGQGQQRWRAAQRLMPIIALMAHALAVQPVALPQCVIGVLQGQRRQRIVQPLTESPVQRGEFTGEYAQRPTISDDVVQGQQQHVPVFGQAQQTPTNRQIIKQIERLCGFFANHTLQRLFVLTAQVLPEQIRDD